MRFITRSTVPVAKKIRKIKVVEILISFKFCYTRLRQFSRIEFKVENESLGILAGSAVDRMQLN